MEWDDVVGSPSAAAASWPDRPRRPELRLEGVDELIRDATARGLRPFISIHDAPHWAERPAGGPRGTNNPPPQDVADFFTRRRAPLQRHLSRACRG